MYKTKNMKTVKFLALSSLAMGVTFTSCKKEEEKKEEETTVEVSTACGMKISKSDGPQVGDNFITLDADYDGVNLDSLIAINGDDKEWDFSDLISTDDADTAFFIAPSGTPDGVSSNMMIQGRDGEKVFFNSTSFGFNLTSLDFGDTEDIETRFTNPITVIPFPLQRGATYDDAFEIQVTVVDTIDTVVDPFGPQRIPIVADIRQNNTNNFAVDACGKLITPKGEFDCLRYKITPGEAEFSGEISGTLMGAPLTLPIDEKMIEEEGGDEFNIFEGDTYVWIDKDHGFPLLEISKDEDGRIVSVSYLK